MKSSLFVLMLVSLSLAGSDSKEHDCPVST